MAEKIIITGVNGFVGEHVVDTFRADGFSVVGVAYDTTPNEKVADKLNDYVPCNLLDESAVRNIDFSDTRAIIHLAGLSAVGQSFEQPQRYISENAIMTHNLLNHAMTSGFKGRAVVISTGALYSPDQALPLTEESRVTASSPYAIGKLATEDVVSYFHNRGLDTVVARPFNHIGPGQGEGFLLPDLYAQFSAAGSGGSVMVGNINTKRDYTDVRDIVAAYKALGLAEKLDYGIYNICSGHSLSGKEIITLLEKSMGITDVNIVIDSSKVRPTDAMDIFGDYTRINNELGWSPHIDIEKTISDFTASKEI